MKSAIKKLFTKKYAVTPDRIISIIEKSNCKAVSFDIFDTLIKRNVPTPKDVFMLLEKQYRIHFSKNVFIYELRSHAEERAVKNIGRREVNLQEIYQAIEEIDEAEREWLMAEEVRIERAVCQRWQPMGEVFDWCVGRNIPIFLVSDMYLSSDVITELLNASGYQGWEHLYVSDENQANKANGMLFDMVLKKEKLKPGELLHIGDSLKGDYLAPRQRGIRAVLIGNTVRTNLGYFNKEQFKQEKKKGTLSYSIIDSFIKNNIERYDGFYPRLGYAAIGPILYGYCKWVTEQVKKKRIEKVFFLAREGYFLQRGFNIYNEENIQNAVIKVSRRATSGPRLWQAKNMSELLNIVTTDRADFTVNKLLITCGISDGILELLRDNGIFPDETVSSLSQEKAEELFNYIKPLIDSISKEQEKNIRGYLAQLDFSGPMAVCDVGWHGTIQASLQDIFPDEKMFGYYMGRYDKASKYPITSNAFLFENNINREIFQCVMGAKDLFELFFMSDDGSASHYVKNDDGTYICKVFPPEQDTDSMECIISMQDAACDFVRDFKRLDDALEIETDPFSCSAAYRQFVKHMSNKTIKELRRFSFLNVVRHSLVAEQGLGWYLLRPKCLINDFLNNGCKAPFLKSVFRLPLPYIRIVDLLREFDRP